MFLGKSVCLFFLCLFSVTVSSALSVCTQNDVTKVNECFQTFQQEIFSKYNLSHLIQYYYGYAEKTKEWKGIDEICENLKPLQKCLGPELIENCINFNDFSFDKISSINRFYVLHFLQVDYYCGKGYEVFKNNFGCLMSIIHHSFGSSCDKRIEVMKKKANLSKSLCGSKEAECFTKTYETFELCSQNCEVCKTLDKSTAKNLCDDIYGNGNTA